MQNDLCYKFTVTAGQKSPTMAPETLTWRSAAGEEALGRTRTRCTPKGRLAASNDRTSGAARAIIPSAAVDPHSQLE